MIDKLKANLAAVRQRIDEASRKSGRDATAIRLIAVTKYVDHQITRALIEAGCQDIGENRPQMLWDKADKLADVDVNWHMIGHLQRNKVKRTVACSHLIHSVDSKRLLTAINDTGRETNTMVNVLLEVNVSMEPAKKGFHSDELPEALAFVSTLEFISVNGLMCMAGLGGDADEARREFSSLRELKEKSQASSPDNVDLAELSMGMSRDFEMAIEEGATMVRVGSVLFEGI